MTLVARSVEKLAVVSKFSVLVTRCPDFPLSAGRTEFILGVTLTNPRVFDNYGVNNVH